MRRRNPGWSEYIGGRNRRQLNSEMLERLRTAAAAAVDQRDASDQRVRYGLGEYLWMRLCFLWDFTAERPANGIVQRKWEKIYSMLKVLNDSIEHRGTSGVIIWMGLVSRGITRCTYRSKGGGSGSRAGSAARS